MKSVIFIILTIVKVAVIIYFAPRIMTNVFKKGDPTSKHKAFIQFITMFGILLSISVLEFGITSIIPSDN